MQMSSLLGTLLPVQEHAHVTCLSADDIDAQGVVHCRAQGSAAHLCVVIPEDTQMNVVIDVEASTCDIEVHAAVGAQVTLVCVQQGMNAVRIRQKSRIEANATVQWHNVTLGADVEQDVENLCVGAHAVSDVNWLFYIRGDESCKLNVRNGFLARAGGGEILMRGVAEDRAHGVCHGMIAIQEGGGGTDTYLTQEVLMLDPSAKVDAVPGLEIQTNDVKASHSATVARVTDEDLFYFAARCIAPVDARRMFLLGFLGAVAERIASDSIRSTVVQAIEQKYESVV